MAESVDDVISKQADAAIAALKRQKPTSADAARARAVELQRAYEIRDAAARKVVDANAAKRIANGGNGAQPVQGEASDELIDALARSTARFVKATIAPLKERLGKLEGAARKAEPRRALTWICEDANAIGDSGRNCDECGSCGPRMRSGPTLLNAVWMAVARRPDEFLCGACVLQRCRERLGRELKADDLRGSDDNRAWLAVLK